MDNTHVSIFQLLTRIEQILKTYQQNKYEIQQIVKIFEELQQLKLSAEIIFQQLIPNKDKLIGLKITLYKQILRVNSRFSSKGLEIENSKLIDFNRDSFLNYQEVEEILRKISAIKGEAMFVNQQLSIQTLQQNSDQQATNNIDQISLRKLIKQYLRKCRSTSRLQFLTPLCIRFVVLEESIMVYLQKTLKLLCSISNEGNDLVAEEQKTTVHTIKSVSSLSASIQQFLQNQSRNGQEEKVKTSIEVQQCRSFHPVIKSDFIFDRVRNEQRYAGVNYDPRKKNCCLWF